MNVEKMLQQQNAINDQFLNMPIERLDDVQTITIPPEAKNVSPTRFFEMEDGVVIIKRFVSRKLYSVTFTNGLRIGKVNDWLELNDETFLKLAKVELLQPLT